MTSTTQLADWLEAELDSRQPKPQPTGSVTVEQYAELRELSYSHASKVLTWMVKRGVARREFWNRRYIYFLNKKAKKQ